MEKLYFEDFCDLSDFMYDIATTEKSTVCAVLNYDQTVELLRCLMVFDDIEVITIDVSHSIIKGYTKEYYVTLSRDLKLFVEPAYNNDVVVENYADVFLFEGDVSSKIALNNKGTQFEISVGEDGEECSDYEEQEREIAKQAINSALDFLSFLLGGCNE